MKAKWQSILAFIIGIILIFVGIFVLMPSFEIFGVVFTFGATLFTITHGINVWRKRGISLNKENSEESIEEKLERIEKLHETGMITKEEYLERRQEALKKYK